MEKKKFLVFFGITILISISGIIAWSSTTFAEETAIPNWIRNTALWWGEEKISDGDFINALHLRSLHRIRVTRKLLIRK